MGTLLKTIQRAGENILLAEDFLAHNPIVAEGDGAEG